MAKNQEPLLEGDIPWGKLAAPARRALTGAGFYNLAELAKVPEKQIKQLHGIGPNALKVLREVLAERNLSFAESKVS